MAKQKKRNRKGARRRRIGAALNPSSNLVKGGAVLAGYFLAPQINAQIDKLNNGKLGEKMLGAGQTGLGALLLLSKGGGKMAIVKTAVGGLVAGSGLKRALVAYNVLKPAVAVVPPPATTAGIGYNVAGRVGYANNGAYMSRVGNRVAGANQGLMN